MAKGITVHFEDACAETSRLLQPVLADWGGQRLWVEARKSAGRAIDLREPQGQSQTD